MHGELGAKAPNLTLDELGRNRGVRGTAGEPRGGGLRAALKRTMRTGGLTAVRQIEDLAPLAQPRQRLERPPGTLTRADLQCDRARLARSESRVELGQPRDDPRLKLQLRELAGPPALAQCRHRPRVKPMLPRRLPPRAVKVPGRPSSALSARVAIAIARFPGSVG